MNKKSRYNEVVELYNSGVHNQEEISKRLNLYIGTVGKHIRDAKEKGDIPKEKNTYDKVVECYDNGITKSKEIEKITGIKESTVRTYISKIRKDRKEPKISSYDKLIELCNTTEYSLEEIAEQLHLKMGTVRGYYEKGRKEEKIHKKVKGVKKEKVDKYKIAVERFEQGCDIETISSELNISEKAARELIDRYQKEQEKNAKKEKYEKVIKLLKEDVISPKEISKLTGIPLYEVRRIKKRAKTNKEVEIKSNYERVVKLYESGVLNYKEIQEKLGVSESTVRAHLKTAQENGRIKPTMLIPRSRVEIEYDLGNTSIKKIANNTGVSSGKVERYLQDYRKRTEIEKEKLIKGYIFTSTNRAVMQEKYGLSDEKMERLEILLKKKYPYEIASELNIPLQHIYDIIDNMRWAERKRMNESFLINNSVYKKVSALRRKGVPVNEAIEEIKGKQKKAGLIEIAELYYVLEQNVEAEKVLNKIIYGEDYSEALKRIAMDKKEKIKIEARNKEIRSFYKDNLKKYGSTPSYEIMCKKFGVRMSLIVDLLGREELCL